MKFSSANDKKINQVSCVNHVFLYFLNFSQIKEPKKNTAFHKKSKNSFQYVKIMLPLFRAVVKFCSTNRLLNFISYFSKIF